MLLLNACSLCEYFIVSTDSTISTKIIYPGLTCFNFKYVEGFFFQYFFCSQWGLKLILRRSSEMSKTLILSVIM